MHDTTIGDGITREVLGYYAQSDEAGDALTIDMVRVRCEDEGGWRVRRARKMLCVMLGEHAGMTVPEIAAYIDRTVQTVYYHQRDVEWALYSGGADAYEWKQDTRNIMARLFKGEVFKDARGTRAPTSFYAGGRDRRRLRRDRTLGAGDGMERQPTAPAHRPPVG